MSSDICNSIAIAVVSSFGEYYVFVRVNAPGVWVADATPPTMLALTEIEKLKLNC